MTPTTAEPGYRHSLEDLDQYLRTGQPNLEPHLKTCAECRSNTRALTHLHDLTAALIQDDIHRAETGDTTWLENIVAKLRLETRAGQTLPFTPSHTEDPLPHTEGSVTALLRTTGDTITGATIGRCQLHGDLATPGAEVRVQVHISALWGHPLPDLVRTLRHRLFDALTRHTELNITGIDITVTDIHAPTAPIARNRP
jgi:hypothetical protein